MYNVVKEFNPETKLAEKDGRLFVLKRISLDELELVKVLMNIDCINVVKFYETVALENEFYAVEEYINGVTLSDYIKQKGPLDDKAVTDITLALCNGLKAVHAAGIIHRDINPNNIMLDGYGVVKIIDFGISRTHKAQSSVDTHILGTQGYAAPEQYGFAQTGPKADIYSLGVLINYMKTLALPNVSLTQGFYTAIVQKCTMIDENNRFENVDELVAALRSELVMKKRAPGFRKNVLWHKALAIIYYVFIALAIFVYLVPDEKAPYSENVYYLMFIVFVMALPVLLFFNVGDWVSCFPLTKRFNEADRRKAQIVTGIIYTFAAFLAFIIIYK